MWEKSSQKVNFGSLYVKLKKKKNSEKLYNFPEVHTVSLNKSKNINTKLESVNTKC